jgi:hypothetical protein
MARDRRTTDGTIRLTARVSIVESLLAPLVFLASLVAFLTSGCGSQSLGQRQDASDSGRTDMQSQDAPTDAAAGCTASGAPSDAAPYIDQTCSCPVGTACVAEIGGVAGGGGFYCSPIPAACHGVPTCTCMEACACPHFGFRNLSCSEAPTGGLECDDGIR